MPGDPSSLRVGCDIGGTFTDFVVFDEVTGQIEVHKQLSTPDEPDRAVVEGVQAIEGQRPDLLAYCRQFVHASTLVPNAVLERKGARVGLITTEGFRDVLEMRRHVRTHTFDMYGDPSPPLVPRHYRRAVRERVVASGEVLTPLDPEDVAALVRWFAREGIESIAVSYLHAYANDAHERQSAAVIAREAPDMSISLSSAVVPQLGEFERVSTTVVNAYVKPLISHYLADLERSLRSERLKGSFLMMFSNGGLASLDAAREHPVRMVESGPAAGALAAQFFGRLMGIRDVVAFDMGGTTAKVCLLRDGRLPISHEIEVDRSQKMRKGSGLPTAIPSVDLIEVGAGGGSIARINTLGLVQVGPHSAGAKPGPISYGLGGEEPTVTDADLILGYLGAESFLGGRMRLQTDPARRGLETHLGQALGLSATEAAWKVHDVVNESMASAVRIHVVEKGGDPAQATLVAFGGAGPVHAYNLARKLKIHRVLVPFGAGVMSALGLLVAPVEFHLTRTYKAELRRVSMERVEAIFRDLEAEGERVCRQAEPDSPVTFHRGLDMCYFGQGYTVAVDPGSRPVTELTRDDLRQLFDESYQLRYGYVYPDVEAAVVNLRVTATAETRQLTLRRPGQTGATLVSALKGTRPAYSAEREQFVEHVVYDRYRLEPGMALAGPAIVEEHESTTIVGVSATATVDEWGSVLIEMR